MVARRLTDDERIEANCLIWLSHNARRRGQPMLAHLLDMAILELSGGVPDEPGGIEASTLVVAKLLTTKGMDPNVRVAAT